MQGTLFPDLLAGPRSGKHGAVSRDGDVGIEQVKFWSLSQTNAVEDLVHSASKGGHNRQGGFDDNSIQIEGFGGFPNFFPGDPVTFYLFAGPDDGILGHLGKVFAVPSRVSSLTINWNWVANGSLEWSATLDSNGCLGEPSDNSIIDTSELCSPQMCSLLPRAGHCSIDDHNSYDIIENVVSASWTITADNPSYTNSSTNCCTGREAGNLDWTLSIVDQEANRTFAHKDYYGFKFYINATEYWLFRYGISTGISDLRVDRQTGVIKSKTNNFSMSGQLCCGGTDYKEGAIVTPNDVTVWPIAPVAP